MSVAEVVDENGARPSSHPASIRPAGLWEKDHEAPSETVPETVPAAASLPSPNSAWSFRPFATGVFSRALLLQAQNAPVRDIKRCCTPSRTPGIRNPSFRENACLWGASDLPYF